MVHYWWKMYEFEKKANYDTDSATLEVCDQQKCR